jgi:hypothetical protein
LNALNADAKPNELSEAFATLLGTEIKRGFFSILCDLIPALQIIVCLQS